MSALSILQDAQTARGKCTICNLYLFILILEKKMKFGRSYRRVRSRLFLSVVLHDFCPISNSYLMLSFLSVVNLLVVLINTLHSVSDHY